MKSIPALLLSFLFISIAAAQPLFERPVSQPVYAPAPNAQSAPAIASNGTDFLVVWNDWRSQLPSIYATRFAKTGEVLDRTGIPIPLRPGTANVSISGVFWLAGAYVVIFGYDEFPGPQASTQVVRISADGTVIDGPRTVLDGNRGLSRAAASNGSRIVLAYGKSTLGTMAVLDDHANVIRADVALPGRMAGWGWTVVSNGSQFLITSNSYIGGPSNYLNFATVDGEGLITGDVASIAASAIGEGPVITSDGSDYMVLFVEARDGKTYAQRVSSAAQPLTSSVVPFGFPLVGLNVAAAIWTGDSYLFAATDFRNDEQNLASFRLSRTGEPIGGLIQLTASGTPGFTNVPALASNGTDIALAWSVASRMDPSRIDVAAQILGLDANPRSSPVVMESATEQVTPFIATNGALDLVAWAERDGIYASRIPRSGESLDGRGIQVSSDGGRDPRVVWDASTRTFLVAWIGEAALRARRVDAASGTVAPTLVVAPCATEFDLTADDSGVTAAAVQCAGWSVAVMRIGIAGVTGQPVPITQPNTMASTPRIASNGHESLVVWTSLQPDYTIPIDKTVYRGSIYGARITSSLSLLDAQPIGIAVAQSDDNAAPAVASDGNDFLVAWQRLRGDENHQVHLRYISADGALLNGTASDPGLEVSTGWARPESIVWDGARYAIAYAQYQPWGLRRVYLTHAGRDGDLLPNDRIELPANGAYDARASLISRGNGRVAATYSRIATEPLYGGVMRVFVAEQAAARIRAVVRR